ncbi:MAG: hypothetical protein ABSC23_20855 [Bryobacteraceae bacterium]|jgi:hypothetical protein
MFRIDPILKYAGVPRDAAVNPEGPHASDYGVVGARPGRTFERRLRALRSGMGPCFGEIPPKFLYQVDA